MIHVRAAYGGLKVNGGRAHTDFARNNDGMRSGEFARRCDDRKRCAVASRRRRCGVVEMCSNSGDDGGGGGFGIVWYEYANVIGRRGWKQTKQSEDWSRRGTHVNRK